MIVKVPKSSQRFKVTYLLIALNITVYILGAIIGGNALETGWEFYSIWGQNNAMVLYLDAYYQLFTSMFVHASIVHLAGNMMFLLIFGLRAEEMFSLPEYLGIYFVGGLVGNLLSLIPTLLFEYNFISVGASGAIFALFGAAIIYDRKAMQQSIIGALIFAFFLLFINMGEGVNVLAHFGGLAFGLAIGYVIASRRKPEQETQYTISYSYRPT